MKALLLVLLTAVVVSVISVGVCHWYEHRETLKRVVVSYTEKYEDNTGTTDYEKVRSDDALYAEEQLSSSIAQDKTCMVLTHDKNHADYSVDISVIRFGGDPKIYGEATLTITRSNGDVVVTKHFFQDKKSREDIAHQPITETWEMLCKAK